jgi:hypothetical protein
MTEVNAQHEQKLIESGNAIDKENILKIAFGNTWYQIFTGEMIADHLKKEHFEKIVLRKHLRQN